MAKRQPIVIVGAGPGGLMCAVSAARQGLPVLVLEAGSARDYARPCIVELAKDTFEHCGVTVPEGDEIAFTQRGAQILTSDGREAFRLAGHAVYAVRQDRLVHRLHEQANALGVKTRFGWRALAPVLEGDRVVGVEGKNARGKREVVRGPIVIDATGHAAVLVRRLPTRLGMDFVDRTTDHVLAEARLYSINVARARLAVAAGDVEDEITVHRVGIQGTYSTLTSFVSLKNAHAFVLTGVKEENTPPGPAKLLDDLAAQYDFFGNLLHRGAKAIRIRRAGARLVCDGFATLGEAGSMVVPSHASGVASAMLSGNWLGRHLSRVFGSGGKATTATLWPWAAAYQCERGAVLATYDANRRVLEGLNETEAANLMASGVVRAADMERTLVASPLRLDLSSLPGRLSGVLRHPFAAAKLFAFSPWLFAVGAHWRRYPREWDYQSFYRWKRRARYLLP